MTTVYDLSYILLDFQAVINNMTKLVYDSMDEKYEIMGEKINKNYLEWIENIEEPYAKEKYGIEYPGWQKEIENNIETLLYDTDKKQLVLR